MDGWKGSHEYTDEELLNEYLIIFDEPFYPED